jgi:hypothetical protein
LPKSPAFYILEINCNLAVVIVRVNLMTISLLISRYVIMILWPWSHSMRSCIDKIPEFTEILIGDDGSTEEFRDNIKSLEGSGV